MYHDKKTSNNEFNLIFRNLLLSVEIEISNEDLENKNNSDN